VFWLVSRCYAVIFLADIHHFNLCRISSLDIR